MQCASPALPSRTLTELSLEAGQHWVHPETFLEYEDYHSWFAGDDPIPHWRNARVKDALHRIQVQGSRQAQVASGIHFQRAGRRHWITAGEYLQLEYAALCQLFDRDGGGDPF